MKVEEWSFTAQSVGRLAVTLHLLLRENRLALPDDRELLDELGNVRLRESSPGVFRLDHDSGQHDDRAVALGLAALALTETPDYAGVSRITNPNVAAALAAAADPGSPAARPVVRTNTDAAPARPIQQQLRQRPPMTPAWFRPLTPQQQQRGGGQGTHRRR